MRDHLAFPAASISYHQTAPSSLSPSPPSHPPLPLTLLPLTLPPPTGAVSGGAALRAGRPGAAPGRAAVGHQPDQTHHDGASGRGGAGAGALPQRHTHVSSAGEKEEGGREVGKLMMGGALAGRRIKWSLVEEKWGCYFFVRLYHWLTT